MMTIEDSAAAGLIARVRGEFREMPGLSLTIEQACRLWGCDAVACRYVIDMLVAAGEIRWSRDGRLIRARSPDDEALR